MAKYTKPNYAEQWASAGNIVAPNSAKIQAGHIVEKPNYEYMNWLQNRQDTAIAYSLQMGIPEWDNTTQYQYTSNSHASYVQRNGVVYKAIQTGTNKDPLTEAAYWTIAFDDKGMSAAVQSNLNTHITDYGTLTGLTNTATARTNLDVYSKTEAAQKNGDATKLFSVANGTTGNEAVNKSQLDAVANAAITNEQIVKLVYPVGSLIEFQDGTDPNTLWPYTTWTVYGEGRVTVAQGGDFATLGAIGGQKSVKMTANMLIEHDHEYLYWFPGGDDMDGMSNDAVSDTSESRKTTKTGSADPEPIPTMPPYIVVKRWVRTT